MPCGYVEGTLADLEQSGWMHEWSFHANVKEQWDSACDKAAALQRTGDWEIALVKGQTREEILDGVTYMVKKKTAQRKKWDEENR
jgi:hypothetical protein